MQGGPKPIMKLRIVRFKEGAKLYGVSEKTFIEMGRDNKLAGLTWIYSMNT